MKHTFTLVLAGLALIGAGCAPAATSPTQTQSGFGSSVTLTAGNSVQFEDGLRATLTAVNDSRCPKDVQCIWAGELSPVIQFSGGSLTADSTVILGTTTRESATVGSYDVTLLGATETTATISVTK